MFRIFEYSANIILILNFILFLSRFTKENKAYKIYTIYLGLIVTVQMSLKAFVYFGYENLVLSHAYFTGQFIALSFFYLELMKLNYQKKIILWNLFITTAIILFSLNFDKEKWFNFNQTEILFTSISIIVYSTFHFYNMLSNKREFYFINCGILIYLFGSTVTFLPRNLHMKLDVSFYYVLQFLNVVLYILYLLFIFIEWLKLRKSKKIVNGR
jgi:hypothetical protein